MLSKEKENTKMGSYIESSGLSNLLAKVKLPVPEQPFDQENIKEDTPTNEYLTAGIGKLINKISSSDTPVHRIDSSQIDIYINEISDKITRQVKEITDQPVFKELEKTWRGIQFSVFRSSQGIELISYPKESLIEDFDLFESSLEKSGLYQHIYTKAFDQPGAIPFTYMAADYNFNKSNDDIQLLKNISKVSAAAHCLFFASVGHEFFGYESLDDLLREDFNQLFKQHEFIKWNSLRDSDESRYLGLVLNRFLLRLPYGEDNKVKSFNYEEDVLSDSENYRWGNPVFAFIANVNKALDNEGWGLNIRGPENGGKVENLPVHIYKTSTGTHKRIPTEIKISDTKEFALSKCGFIPLCVYENQDYAVFFSAQSIQKAIEYYDDDETASAKLAANIPYMLLLSRIAHYLKIKLREKTGSNVGPDEIKTELTTWLKNLQSDNSNNTSERPLKNFQLKIETYDDSPGYYHIEMSIEPHIQLEGANVNLKLVARLNKKKE